MPPREESLRHSGEWLVICELPDICMTPVCGLPIPVPYDIVSRGQNSCEIAKKTNFTSQPVFHVGSHLQCVEGDERGVAGGIFSGVNCGVCYPMIGSPTVNIESCSMIRHDDPFAMNAAAYGAAGNTIGYAVWMETPDSANNSSDEPAWYQNAYNSAKKKLDEINQDFKKAEQKFGKSVEKILNTDPRKMNQPLGDAARQFGETIKDRGQQAIDSIISIPERVTECVSNDGILSCGYEYGEGVVTGVAKGVPNAAGKFMENVAGGDMGRAFGEVAFDIAESFTKGKAAEAAGISRNAKKQVEKANSKVYKAKDKLKSTNEELRSINKTLRKTGGRIKGSPSKRAGKKAQRAAAKKQKAEAQNQHRANEKDLAKAKQGLKDAKANPNSYKYNKLIKLPKPEDVQCPDMVDGVAQIYINGPCDTSGIP